MINIDEVKKIAKLSKLEFNEDELVKMGKSMNDVLVHIENLNEVNVDNIEPLYNVNEITDITRIDEALNTVDKKDFLDNAPESDSDFVILPKIVG